MKTFLIVASVGVVLASASGAEDIQIGLARGFQPIFIAEGSRNQQLEEIVRQLKVPAILDAGRNWDDGEPDPDAKPIFDAFSFDKGTIADALDAFSKVRSYKWRVWKEANAIVVEPAEALHQGISFYLTKPFAKDALADDGNDHALRLREAWKQSLQPIEAQTGFEVSIDNDRGGLDLGINERGLSAKEAINSNGNPNSMWDVARDWLLHKPLCTIGLHVREHPGVTIGDKRIVCIAFGSHHQSISEIKIKELLVGMSFSGNGPMGFSNGVVRRQICAKELYLRIKRDPNETVDIIKTEKVIEQDMQSKSPGDLSLPLLFMDSKRIGDYAMKVFEESNDETKRIFFSIGMFNDKKIFSEFLKKQANSKDDVIRKKAQRILKGSEE